MTRGAKLPFGKGVMERRQVGARGFSDRNRGKDPGGTLDLVTNRVVDSCRFKRVRSQGLTVGGISMSKTALVERCVDRRRFILGAVGAAAAAGAATSLVWPEPAGASHRPLPAPKPIPGRTDLSGFGLVPPYDFIHTFAPGPAGLELPFTHVVLEGLDVEPSTITDFNGATAIAFHIGKARGSDGKKYDLETDIRVMEGEYVAVDGTTNQGTFALI